MTSNLLENIPIAILESVMIVADSAFSTKETLGFYFKNKVNFLHSLNKYPSLPVKRMLSPVTHNYKDWNIVYNVEKKFGQKFIYFFVHFGWLIFKKTLFKQT